MICSVFSHSLNFSFRSLKYIRSTSFYKQQQIPGTFISLCPLIQQRKSDAISCCIIVWLFSWLTSFFLFVCFCNWCRRLFFSFFLPGGKQKVNVRERLRDKALKHAKQGEEQQLLELLTSGTRQRQKPLPSPPLSLSHSHMPPRLNESIMHVDYASSVSLRVSLSLFFHFDFFALVFLSLSMRHKYKPW